MRLLLIALCLLAGPAAAADYAASAIDWTIAGRTVLLRVGLPSSDTVTSDYLLAHVDVRAGAARCPAIEQGEGVGQVNKLSPLPGLSRYEIMFECPAAGMLRLDDHVLFDRNPAHLGFARLHTPGHPDATLLYDLGHQSAVIAADGTPPGASPARFAWLGLTQMLASFGRVALVLLVLAQLRRGRDWLACAAAMVAGAAVSLTLVLGDAVAVQAEAAEAMLALLALLMAIRHAALSYGRATILTAVSVIALLAFAEAMHSHAGTVQTLLGGALLTPALLANTRWGVRLGVLAPSAMLGLLGDLAFDTTLRSVRFPPDAAAMPEASHAAGALLAVFSIAAVGASVTWLLRRNGAMASFARLSPFARTGLAGYCAFWLVKVLHA